MSTLRKLSWLIAALPLAATAQIPGLDLSEPPRDTPAEKPAEQPPPEEPPLPPPPTEPKRHDALQNALGAPGERDAALDDRVKAVQRKGFLKRGRLEGSVFFSPSVNDAFYQKLGAGLRLAYHLQDSFALALRGVSYTPLPGFLSNLQFPTTYPTSNVRTSKAAYESVLLNSTLDRQLMSEAVWSPVYGKVAWLGSHIIHFDLFLTAGFGAVWTATSSRSLDQGGGPHLATDFGGGIRFYPTDWFALEAGLLATLYPDQPSLAVPSTVQKVLVANFGVSFFFPTAFEYVYP